MNNKFKSLLLFFSTLILTTLIIGCDDSSNASDAGILLKPVLTVEYNTSILEKGIIETVTVSALDSEGNPEGYYVISSDYFILSTYYNSKTLLTKDSFQIIAERAGDAVITILSESGETETIQFSVQQESLKVHEQTEGNLFLQDGTLHCFEGYLGVMYAEAKNYLGEFDIYEIISGDESILQVQYYDGRLESEGLLGIIFSGLNTGDTTFTIKYGEYEVTYPVTVHAAEPTLYNYTAPQPVYNIDVEIRPNVPVAAGKVTRYYVTPALPDGLVLDEFTGIITGTPTVQTPSAIYTIIAENRVGIGQFKLNITIE